MSDVDRLPTQFGRYEIVRRLAAGGMGAVHLARARGPGGFERLVAIKTCHPHLRDDPELVAMFLDEARIAAAIRHPNVVPTLELGESPELYMVMEYVEGTTLRKLLRITSAKRAALPLPVVLRVLTDVLRGLHAAHELRDSSGRPLRVVHRDVSPANVLIGLDGLCRLTDFGVAKAEARAATTHGKTAKGKFAYMAPEQLRGDPLDRRADLFAAGIVAWESLTTQRLFGGNTEADSVSRVLSSTIVPPSSVRADVPPAIDRVVMRALSREPDARHASAEEMADELERCGIELAPRASITESVRQCANEEVGQPPAALRTHTQVPVAEPTPAGPAPRSSDGAAAAAPPAERAAARHASPGPSASLRWAIAGIALVGIAIVGVSLWLAPASEGSAGAPEIPAPAAAIEPPTPIAATSETAPAAPSGLVPRDATTSASAPSAAHEPRVPRGGRRIRRAAPEPDPAAHTEPAREPAEPYMPPSI